MLANAQEAPDRTWIDAHVQLSLEGWIQALKETWPAKSVAGSHMGRAERADSIRTVLGWKRPAWIAYRRLVEEYDGIWGRTSEEAARRERAAQKFIDTLPLREGGYREGWNLGLHLRALRWAGTRPVSAA